MSILHFILLYFIALFVWSCGIRPSSKMIINPIIITERVSTDSDDPAIWIHPTDPSKSLIIGTDKGGDTGAGGLYVFDLMGKIDRGKTVKLSRPNNVDIAYGLNVNGKKTDIAVCTERNTNSIRVFSLPDMKMIDGGGIPVFEDSPQKSPMGLALYTDQSGNIYAIVGRKFGPKTEYLYQYKLWSDVKGVVSGNLVRKFGNFSGKKEIESIAVDNELGYVYCSDEGVAVRKYYAHPDSSYIELASFATKGIRQDHEGISIYKSSDKTGYILLSDQQANAFHIFPREGTNLGPHDHPLIKKIYTATKESDGSDVTNIPLNSSFKKGLFVAMSTDGTFQYYRWEDIAGFDLMSTSNIEKN